MPISIFATVAALLLLPAAGHAQAPAKAPTRLQATVGDVTDNRSTGAFGSECKLELKFTGDAAADAGSVRMVRLTEAVDELGRDLKPTEEREAVSSRDATRQHHGPLKTELTLRNPSRNAATIKSLKGEVELFRPTEANGGLLTIKDILKHPAEPVQSPALTKYGITLIYLTKESYEAKKKELEAQQAKDGGAAGQKLGEAFGELFKGMFGGMMSSDSKNALQMYIKDPEKRVLGLEFQDAQGKPLKTQGRFSSSDFQQTELAAPPPADTQLVIQLATPTAVQAYPFELHDIALP